jgi:hypothetical protein
VSQRLFTPEQANAALTEVRPLVERLVEHRADLLAAQARLAELAAGVAGNGGIDPKQQAAFASAAADADLDAGLVDFPSEREGAPVYLCWQLGEAAVAFWHGIEEGFAGRKPI